MDAVKLLKQAGALIGEAKQVISEIEAVEEVKDGEIGLKKEFEDIQPEEGVWKNYFSCPINEFFDLSMVVDVYDPVEKIVIDWKTGSKPSTQQNKLQVYMYAYGLSKLPKPIEIDWGVMAHVVESADKKIFCSDYTVYKITPEKLEVAENYIETIGSEIYNFVQELRDGSQE